MLLTQRRSVTKLRKSGARALSQIPRREMAGWIFSLLAHSPSVQRKNKRPLSLIRGTLRRARVRGQGRRATRKTLVWAHANTVTPVRGTQRACSSLAPGLRCAGIIRELVDAPQFLLSLSPTRLSLSPPFHSLPLFVLVIWGIASFNTVASEEQAGGNPEIVCLESCSTQSRERRRV